MRPPVPFKWKGNHHSYYGIFFMVFGIFNTIMGIDNSFLSGLIPFWMLITILGFYFIIDDYIEHNITADTPLRLLYEYIFRKHI